MATPPPLPNGLIRQGNAIKAPLNVELPQVCIKTGSREDLLPLHRNLAWSPPWTLVLIVTGLLLYVIVSMILQKKTSIVFYVSKAAKARQLKWHLANWGVFLSGILCVLLAGICDNGWFVLGFPVMLIACLIIYVTQVRWVSVKHMDDQSVTLGGICPSALDQMVNGGSQSPEPSYLR